jgi:putative phosphoribosyl transferase
MENRNFEDRSDAGGQLAEALRESGLAFDLVFALVRGGVPVGVPVARAFKIPLIPMVVRKIGMPGHKELALGAISEGDTVIWNPDLTESGRFAEDELARLRDKARAEVRDKIGRLRSGKALPPVSGKKVLVVDDGAATGATVLAAVKDLESMGAASVTVALPVAPASFLRKLKRLGIASLILKIPPDFQAVGEWYDDFREVTDGAVLLALQTSDASAKKS